MQQSLALVCTALALAPCLRAQDQDPPKKPERELHWESGSVTVDGDYATIALPEGWRYLQRSDARYVVERLWGNPPDPSTRGLVAGVDPLLSKPITRPPSR